MSKKVYKNVILFIVGFCLYITIEVLFRGQVPRVHLTENS